MSWITIACVCLFVCYKWSSRRNLLTAYLGMVICMHYLARVNRKLTQGHFLQTFRLFRKCHFKDHGYVFTNPWRYSICSLLFELWERTNWHPVSMCLHCTLHEHYLTLVKLNHLIVSGRASITIFWRGKRNFLRGYCTPDQFLDCLGILLKNYKTLVTSKICFL